ncbi:MAG: DUF1592 domain-containing protein [Pirellulaceae bacterium]|nr:DUF1592 domain-containing protein [Pirellulaceae bacterium]
MKQMCLECHRGAEPDGGLTLEHLETSQTLLKERRIWQKVIQRVRIGEMPPPESDVKLADAERARFVSWLEVAINDIDCGRTPNPGRVTLRRLNRFEYRNTVRDLVGIDYDAAQNFPGDDVGYGFDNIGDVLTLPPLLMEKYVKAAEEIASKAIVAPESGANFELILPGDRLKVSEGAKASDKRLNFFSDGAGEFGEQVPWAGTYRLELDVNADQAGDEPAKLLVSLDGKKVRELPVTAKREDEPQTLALTLKLRAGQRNFKLEFTNDFYVEGQNGQPNQDRNLYLYSARLTSKQAPKPLDPNQLPASHRTLVFVQPDSKTTVDQATRKVIGRLASRAFRRPATATEIDRLAKLAESVREEGETFEAGLQTALTALLVSPHFLYKVEQGAGAALEKHARLSDYELATRLSYFLWSTMPDDRLLLLAFKGDLHRTEVLTAEVKRMIADKRAANFVERFAGQWLTLTKLDSFEPNAQQFPQWNDQLRQLLQRETVTFFAGVMRDDLSIMTLLDGEFTYINEPLAKFYGISNVQGEQFRKVSTKGYPRKGLLTQAAILAVTSNPTRTSPVKRGKWILDNLLGEPPPPAPPNVPELEKSTLTGTLRQRLEQHRANAACASCHKLMDPLGFALENFDAIGRWRTLDGQDRIESSGTLPDGTTVKGAGELIVHLRDEQSEKFARCLTEKMLTFAIGRGLEYYDKCAVDKISAQLKTDNYRFSTLVSQIVLSDPFQRYGERE